MAIVDKKSNLCRGFADNYTPSKYMKELLISAREQRDDLLVEVEKLEDSIVNEADESKVKMLNNLLKQKKKALAKYRERINRKIDKRKLADQRLVEAFGREMVVSAYAMARRDKDELLAMYDADGL